MFVSKMTHSSIRASLMTILVVLLAFTTTIPTFAQNDAPARKTKRVESIPQALIKDFEKLSTAFEEENIPEAQKLIAKIESKDNLNNISRAYIANFKGNIYFSQDNLNAALKEFKKILANTDGVPDGFTSQIRYVVAQVYFSQENYSEALNYAKEWFNSQEDPPADAYLLIGQAQFMLKRYDEALPNVQKGIDKYQEIGATPKESWLNLLSAIYREKKDYKKMVPVLKQLVAFYPKKTYLVTLGGIYNELGDTSKMTALYNALFEQNLLERESELITLASLHLSQDNPYKAVRILEHGFDKKIIEESQKNNRLYSQSLYLAREFERALAPLSKAAKQSKDGKLYNQLGQSYLSLSRFAEAEKAFADALNKGGLRDKGQTYISLGMSRFEQKKFDAAKKAFKSAAKSEKSTKTANNWIKYVDSEVRRIAELKKPIVISTDVEV